MPQKNLRRARQVRKLDTIIYINAQKTYSLIFGDPGTVYAKELLITRTDDVACDYVNFFAAASDDRRLQCSANRDGLLGPYFGRQRPV